MTFHKQIITYDEKPGNPHRLGRHYEWDSRSLDWPTPHKDVANVDTVWPDGAPILNQADIGSCTGDTDADILNTEFFAAVRQAKNNGNYFNQADAYKFYHQATINSSIGGGQIWPPNDTGSSGPAAAQALVQDGYITSYGHATDWNSFCASIEKQPVMVGSIWTQDMFNPDANGVISVGSLDEDNQAGGHEYMVRGILYSKNLVLMRNHWYAEDNVTPWCPGSDGTKLPGEAYITIPDFQRLLVAQGDVTVPIA